MREEKKSMANKHTSSSSKRVGSNNHAHKMPPKVKKVDIDEINKDFDDIETDDKRLIVFIAIAILVIVGVIVGLLVGCEKKENNVKEPDKPNSDVVIPDDTEEEEEGVKTREVVRKVKATYKSSTKKSKKSKKDNKKVYTVTFYLGEENETQNVEGGKALPSYVPKGYKSCSYFKDSDLTEEFDMNSTVSSNVNVYMSCELIEYTVVYESTDERATIQTTNPTTYNVKDETITLTDPVVVMNDSQPQLARKNVVDNTVPVLYFDGWFTNSGCTEKVTSLNKDIVDYADDKDEIHIYAKLTEEEPQTTEETPAPEKDETLGESESSREMEMQLENPNESFDEIETTIETETPNEMEETILTEEEKESNTLEETNMVEDTNVLDEVDTSDEKEEINEKEMPVEEIVKAEPEHHSKPDPKLVHEEEVKVTHEVKEKPAHESKEEVKEETHEVEEVSE